ncbi:hypothetical protein HY345_01725 [Candidatus Microgenomates bacterium]|nr:hypothetical protein [Candidatus Microgenomates bacterium]
MKLPCESVISIYIPKQGFVSQGKFCFIAGKPSFVANMTERKWFRNYGGYAISRRILDNLPKGTQIIFKREDLNQYYTTNATTFRKKGILGSWGGHSQYCLPIKNWKPKEGKLLNEPKDKLIMPLEGWLKSVEPAPQPTLTDPLISYKTRAKLAELWRGING